MNASTFTARVIASTGADVAAALSGAVGAMSGPLHGGAPSRVLAHDRGGRADRRRARRTSSRVLDKGERLMGFGHRVYRAEDPRARVLRRTARELGAPRYEVAEALEKAALAELRERRPDRVLETNVEFWAAIMLDFAEVPAHMFTSMFTCARLAGLERAHPRAEAHRPADPAVGAVRRPRDRASPRTSPAGTRSWSRRPGTPRSPDARLAAGRAAVARPVPPRLAPWPTPTDPDPGRPAARGRPVRLRPVQGPPRAGRRAGRGRRDVPRHVAPADDRARAGRPACAPGSRSCSRCRTATRWCCQRRLDGVLGRRRRSG